MKGNEVKEKIRYYEEQLSRSLAIRQRAQHYIDDAMAHLRHLKRLEQEAK